MKTRVIKKLAELFENFSKKLYDTIETKVDGKEMALIKYIGIEDIVVNINSQRTLIKPNKIFSGPTSFKDFPNFQIIGYDKKEKEITSFKKGTGNIVQLVETLNFVEAKSRLNEIASEKDYQERMAEWTKQFRRQVGLDRQ